MFPGYTYLRLIVNVCVVKSYLRPIVNVCVVKSYLRPIVNVCVVKSLISVSVMNSGPDYNTGVPACTLPHQCEMKMSSVVSALGVISWRAVLSDSQGARPSSSLCATRYTWHLCVCLCVWCVCWGVCVCECVMCVLGCAGKARLEGFFDFVLV